MEHSIQIPHCLSHAEISYMLWIVFLVLIPILLGNLLVCIKLIVINKKLILSNPFQIGLAVDDVKKILNTAKVKKLKSKVKYINLDTSIALICINFHG